MDKTGARGGVESGHSLWTVPLVSSVVLILVLATLFSDTAASVVTFWWESSQYSYGFLVVIVSAYLIWQRRMLLGDIVPVPSKLGLSVLIALSLLWLVSRLVGVMTVEYVSFIMMFPALIWAVFGNQTGRVLFFPLSYLIFATPIWDPVASILQDMTAVVAYKVLQFQGIPTLMEGYYLTIPEGRFLIEEVCGGLRFLLASMALGSLYVYVFFEGNRKRLMVFSIIVFWSIALNWLRVLIIIWIGHLTDMQHWMVEDHEGLGWALYAGLMYPLLWILMPKEKQKTGIISETKFKPRNVRDEVLPLRKQYLYGGVLTGLIIFFVVIKNVESQALSLPNTFSSVDLVFPKGAEKWIGPEYIDDGWRPLFHGADKVLAAKYHKGDESVMLYVAYYAHQRQGAELINSENGFFTGANEVVVPGGVRHILVSDFESQQVVEVEFRSSKEKVIWYWYNVAGISTTSQITAKLLDIWGAIISNRSAMVVSISIDSDQGADSARRELALFYRQMMPHISVRLDELNGQLNAEYTRRDN